MVTFKKKEVILTAEQDILQSHAQLLSLFLILKTDSHFSNGINTKIISVFLELFMVTFLYLQSIDLSVIYQGNTLFLK